jgi:heme o synthase
MTRVKNNITFSTFLELAKVRITIAVSLTTITGGLLWDGRITTVLLGVVVGIFLLACGSSVFNHIQDRRYDERMKRTRNRPLVTEKIPGWIAWTYGGILTLTGITILFLLSNWIVGALGILAMVWYNIIYAYAKRITAYAVIPGSVIGAIPPVIGWISAGGAPDDPRMIAMALFFFIWQVPHFWLLMVKYGSEYTYAGYPSLKDTLRPKQITLMIYLWVLATGMIAVMLPSSGLIRSTISSIGIWVTAACLLAIFTRGILLRDIIQRPVYYFKYINFFVVLTVLFMILDSMLV